MTMDASKEETVIGELDGQKVLSARLVNDNDCECLVLTIEGGMRGTIKPRREGDRLFLQFDFQP